MRVATFVLVVLSAASATANALADDRKACTDAYVAAQTLRDEHHLLAARDQLQICARDQCSSAMRGQMVKDCTSWLAEVEAAIPSLVFEVKDGKGNDLSAVKVTMDGQALADKLGGSAIPVDPGEHRFRFDDADGLAHTEKTIVVRDGDKDRHERVVLGPATTAAPGTIGSPAIASPAGSDGSSQRTIGLVLGGAGIVGLVVGTVFRITANSAYQGVLSSDCSGNANSCNSNATADEGSANTQARVSTIGFIAGGVLLAGGAVLYFTAPTAGSVGLAPTVGTNGAGLSVAGAWW